MTGFGAGEATLGAGRVVVEARSVNGRHLDVRTRAPAELAELSHVLDEVARATLERGRVELSARLEGRGAPAPILDLDRARAALEALRALRDDVAPGEPVPLSLLAVVPDLFTPRPPVDADAAGAALKAAAERAVRALLAMREREGERLAEDLRARLALLDAALARLRVRAPEVVGLYRTKLRERIARLVDAPRVPVDEGRLEHEVALFADRADIAEEITRLASHVREFQASLTAPEAVGRKLDFLLQEMLREANTIGSKSTDALLTTEVVEIKAELERLREQVQNVL